MPVGVPANKKPMYFEYSIRKFTLLLLIVLVLAGTVYGTFTVKSDNYGSVRLPTAMKRFGGYYVLYLKHFVKYSFSEKGGLANLLALTYTKKIVSSSEPAEAIPVLVYHAIIREADGESVDRKTFEEHLYALKGAGWETVPLEEFSAFMHGDKELPQKSFLLTFDDGAKESYYPVDPLLAVLGYEAVSFILPEHSLGDGTYYYLSKGEIEDMIKSDRWDIGSHSYEHDFVPIDSTGTMAAALANRIWIEGEGRTETDEEYKNRIRDDLTNSQRDLESTFKVPVKVFAAPFGDFGQLSQNDRQALDVVKTIANYTYDFAFYQHWEGEGFSYNYPPGDDLMVRRITPRADWSGKTLVEILDEGMPKELPYRGDFSRDAGWLLMWGDYRVRNNILSLTPRENDTGVVTVLDGTGLWEDYRFRMRVESPSQTGVVLWTRFEDNDNLAACNFGNGFVHVEQIVAGEHRVIKGVREDSIRIPQGVFTVEAVVQGRTVSCFLNGREIVSTPFLEPTLERGGIGIKIWDAIPDKARLIVHDLEVEKL